MKYTYSPTPRTFRTQMEEYLKKLIELDPVYKVVIGIELFITLWFGVWSLPFFVFIGGPIALKVYVTVTCGKTQSTSRIDGKVVIVTGANVGIGYETAKDLARRGGKVILACRNVEKAKKAVETIKKENSSADLSVMKLDLSSLKSVRAFCKEFKSTHKRLDILVNNAGAATTEKVITEDGLEANFAGNHFGSFLLTNILLDVLQSTGKARIVMVSSALHKFAKGLDLDNLNSEKSFSPMTLYPRTKLANILFTRELDRRLRAAKITGLTVNAIHPGAVNTELSRHANEIWYLAIFNKIGRLFRKSVVEGAQTQIHVAVAEEVEELSGLYWADCVEAPISTTAQDVKLAKALWAKSAKAVGLTKEETIFELE